MRKLLKILLSVTGTILIVAAAAAVIIYSRSNMSAMNKHKNISDIYYSLCDNIDATKVTVYEDGNEIGEYSLYDLGLSDNIDTLLRESTDKVKIYSEDEFKELNLKEKTLWCSNADVASSIAVDTSEADLSPILEDLNKVERVASKDAEVSYENGIYEIIPEVSGTEIDEDKVSKFICKSIVDINVDIYNNGSISLDIKDSGCYIEPEITSKDIPDYNDLLKVQLSDFSLDVVFHSETVKIGPSVLSKYFSVDKNGKVNADMDGLRKYTESWPEKYDESNVPYLFNSFVGGTVPIDFLKCDYTVNVDDTIDKIIDHVLEFNSEPFEAVYDCCDRKGEPFGITDTYVEVDINNQHLTFYKNGELIVDTPVVTGLPGARHTPTGLYYAHDKQVNRWLTGDDFCVFVNYWIRITGGYGIHDANWRTKFGEDNYLYNGSHGCVNTPIDAMTLVYESIENGDPIIIF